MFLKLFCYMQSAVACTNIRLDADIIIFIWRLLQNKSWIFVDYSVLIFLSTEIMIKSINLLNDLIIGIEIYCRSRHQWI